MIVSDSHNFVFAHVPKVAGISLRVALEPFADGQRAALPDTTHETLPALLAREPRLMGHYKFAFVRNPWDRLVSFYFYAREKLKPTFPQMQSVDFAGMLRLIDNKTAWLRDLYVLCPQHDYVRLADFVGRFETLGRDFARVCARLGLSTTLAHKNASSHSAYASYYDDWSRGFVAERYRQDIEEFGYTFEAVP